MTRKRRESAYSIQSRDWKEPQIFLASFGVVWRSNFDKVTNSAGITYYLIYKASIASMNSDEFINDPRHPRFAKGGKFIDLESKN
jgi:hypothetical protein